jgi:hypothetical protein
MRELKPGCGLCCANGASRQSTGPRTNTCDERPSSYHATGASCDHVTSTGPRQILILGGGFAGVYTARDLEKLLGAEEASITLINRENYWVYQPMLPEVISGSIGLSNVVSPIRRLCPRTKLIMREVEHVDLEKRIVTVSPGFRPRQLEVTYDHLVIALGNVTDFHGMPGSGPIKSSSLSGPRHRSA